MISCRIFEAIIFYARIFDKISWCWRDDWHTCYNFYFHRGCLLRATSCKLLAEYLSPIDQSDQAPLSRSQNARSINTSKTSGSVFSKVVTAKKVVPITKESTGVAAVASGRKKWIMRRIENAGHDGNPEVLPRRPSRFLSLPFSLSFRPLSSEKRMKGKAQETRAIYNMCTG